VGISWGGYHQLFLEDFLHPRRAGGLTLGTGLEPVFIQGKSLKTEDGLVTWEEL